MNMKWSILKIIKLTNESLATENGDVFAPCCITDEGQITFQKCSQTQSSYSLIELTDGRLALGSRDTIIIWNITTNKCDFKLKGYLESFYCLIELKNGLLASWSSSGIIKLWDLNSRQCLTGIITCFHIGCLVELHDGRLIYPCDTTIKLLHPSTYKCVNELKSHIVPVSSMIKLSDERLVSGDCDGIIKIWDTSNYQFNTLVGNSYEVSCLIELRDGNLASSSFNLIQLWNTITFKLIKNYQVDQYVNCFVQTNNGDFVYGTSFSLTPFLLRQ